jgi:hypothetical protein
MRPAQFRAMLRELAVVLLCAFGLLAVLREIVA